MNENKTKNRPENRLCVAAIAGAFGVRGEVKLKSFTEVPEDCVSYGPLTDENGVVILTPKSMRKTGKFFAVRAPEIKTREEAEALKSTKLYVDRDQLPDPDEDEFYYSDLIGLRVVTDTGEDVGHVKRAHDFGSGDLLEIKPTKGPTWYHPFTKAAVPHIDLKTRTVTIIITEAEEVEGEER